MEFTRRLNALLMKLFGGERVLPVLLLSNLGSSLVEFGESTRDCSPGHAGKEGPHESHQSPKSCRFHPLRIDTSHPALPNVLTAFEQVLPVSLWIN